MAMLQTMPSFVGGRVVLPYSTRPHHRAGHLVHSTHPNLTEYSTITATIESPLGLMLAEDKEHGQIIIESITEGSNADKTQLFAPNDILVSCSAIMMKADIEETNKDAMYSERRRKQGCCSTGCPDCPFNARNWARVEFDCRNKTFQTVISALQSNTAPFARALASSSGSGMKRTITITVARPL
mmetsp:Transcript_11681/g.23425  ORF Transcript_11681/g.23425 Transcript_11681/m.23425 type:complete len:184 (-) Transcript_11681:195-746(-)